MVDLEKTLDKMRGGHLPIVRRRHPMLPASACPEIYSICERCNLAFPCDVLVLLDVVRRMLEFVDGEAESECYVMCDCQQLAKATMTEIAKILDGRK